MDEIPADEPIVKKCFECVVKDGKPKYILIALPNTLYSCPECGKLWDYKDEEEGVER